MTRSRNEKRGVRLTFIYTQTCRANTVSMYRPIGEWCNMVKITMNRLGVKHYSNKKTVHISKNNVLICYGCFPRLSYGICFTTSWISEQVWYVLICFTATCEVNILAPWRHDRLSIRCVSDYHSLLWKQVLRPLNLNSSKQEPGRILDINFIFCSNVTLETSLLLSVCYSWRVRAEIHAAAFSRAGNGIC